VGKDGREKGLGKLSARVGENREGGGETATIRGLPTRKKRVKSQVKKELKDDPGKQRDSGKRVLKRLSV